MFQQLINEIYTIDINGKKVNIISYLANLFKEYHKYLKDEHHNNILTIIVGGAPADVIHAQHNHLPTIIKDVDIATNLNPEQIVGCIKWHTTRDIDKPNLHLLEKINLTSMQNGTVNIYVDHEEIDVQFRKLEVTTFRSESGQRGQHIVTPVGHTIPYKEGILIDCQRRDLTIGIGFCTVDTESIAEFKCEMYGELKDHDTFKEAHEDICNGMVRFVGNPRDRISEDGIRILRFIRKSAKPCHKPLLSQFDICLSLLEGLHKAIGLYQIEPDEILNEQLKTNPISKERILHKNDGELIKLLKLNSKHIIELIYERSKWNNLHFLYLPSKFVVENWFEIDEYQNEDVDIKQYFPYVRLAKLYKGMIDDIGLIEFARVDYSVMGDYQIMVLYLAGISDYMMLQGNNLTTKKGIYEYIINLKTIMVHYGVKFNYKNMTRVINKLEQYHDGLALYCKWDKEAYDNFKLIVKECQDKVKEIKKEVYADGSIPKKDKPKICNSRIADLLKW